MQSIIIWPPVIMCDSGKEPGGHLLQLVRDEGMKTGQKMRCGVNNRCRVVHKHLFAVMGRETGEGGNSSRAKVRPWLQWKKVVRLDCDCWSKQQDELWRAQGFLSAHIQIILQSWSDRASQCRPIMSQSKLQKQPKTFSRKAKKVSNVWVSDLISAQQSSFSY